MVELPLLALGVQIPVRTNEIPRLLFKLLISLTRRIGICTNILDPCQTEATFKKNSQHVPISDVGIGLKNYSGVLKSKHVGILDRVFLFGSLVRTENIVKIQTIYLDFGQNILFEYSDFGIIGILNV